MKGDLSPEEVCAWGAIEIAVVVQFFHLFCGEAHCSVNLNILGGSQTHARSSKQDIQFVFDVFAYLIFKAAMRVILFNMKASQIATAKLTRTRLWPSGMSSNRAWPSPWRGYLCWWLTTQKRFRIIHTISILKCCNEDCDNIFTHKNLKSVHL